jgi:hypothetical protein
MIPDFPLIQIRSYHGKNGGQSMRRVNEKQDQVKVQKQPAKPRDILIQMVYTTGSVSKSSPSSKVTSRQVLLWPLSALSAFRGHAEILKLCLDTFDVKFDGAVQLSTRAWRNRVIFNVLIEDKRQPLAPKEPQKPYEPRTSEQLMA